MDAKQPRQLIEGDAVGLRDSSGGWAPFQFSHIDERTGLWHFAVILRSQGPPGSTHAFAPLRFGEDWQFAGTCTFRQRCPACRQFTHEEITEQIAKTGHTFEARAPVLRCQNCKGTGLVPFEPFPDLPAI
jgi:hypothetical protein